LLIRVAKSYKSNLNKHLKGLKHDKERKRIALRRAQAQIFTWLIL
jgi:hypothetical protein